MRAVLGEAGQGAAAGYEVPGLHAPFQDVGGVGWPARESIHSFPQQFGIFALLLRARVLQRVCEHEQALAKQWEYTMTMRARLHILYASSYCLHDVGENMWRRAPTTNAQRQASDGTSVLRTRWS